MNRGTQCRPAADIVAEKKAFLEIRGAIRQARDQEVLRSQQSIRTSRESGSKIEESNLVEFVASGFVEFFIPTQPTASGLTGSSKSIAYVLAGVSDF